MKKLFPVLILSIIFAGCKKDKVDRLPPITQVGANTFGCKINGRVYVPKGSSGNGAPNPKVQYDVDLAGKPFLFMQSKQFENSQVVAGVDLTFNRIERSGFYPAGDLFKFSIGWKSVIGNCGMTTLDGTVEVFGGGIITRLDINNRIISGTFDFKAFRAGCDTMRVTDGRFDLRF